MDIRPVREITAEEENFRTEAVADNLHVIRRDAVEPEPVDTYVVCVFKIDGYDPDCDGSLMARMSQVDKEGKHTGWTVSHIGLYPHSELVVEHPSVLWDAVNG